MKEPAATRPGSVRERISVLKAHLDEHPGIQELAVLGELATLLFGTRQFEEAAAYFSRASELDPNSAELLSNQAACMLELGKYDEAIEVSSRALEINSGLSAALVNRADAHRMQGHFRRAAEDYQKAVQRDPSNPQSLNKAGANLHVLGRHDLAQKHFEAALALSPRFSLAKLNLGLVRLETGTGPAARELIREAISDRRLDAGSREYGSTALAIMKNHDRLAPHLEQALRDHDVAKLAEATSATTETLLFPDREALDMLQELADSCARLEWKEQQFRFAGDIRHLAFLEAAALCRLDPHAESLCITLRSLQQGRQLPADAVKRDLPAVLEAVTDRPGRDPEFLFTGRGEAWVHYWHARLLQHDKKAFPGHYKPVPSIVESTGGSPGTPPGHVAGTLRYALGRLSADVPAGVPRAVFLFSAVSRIQPFKDGNGRLARFISSWVLERSGLHPLIVTSQAQAKLARDLDRTWQERNVQPAFDSLLSAYRSAQQLLNEFNRVSSTTL